MESRRAAACSSRGQPRTTSWQWHTTPTAKSPFRARARPRAGGTRCTPPSWPPAAAATSWSPTTTAPAARALRWPPSTCWRVANCAWQTSSSITALRCTRGGRPRPTCTASPPARGARRTPAIWARTRSSSTPCLPRTASCTRPPSSRRRLATGRGTPRCTRASRSCTSSARWPRSSSCCSPEGGAASCPSYRSCASSRTERMQRATRRRRSSCSRTAPPSTSRTAAG
mmetsp:Transcript_76128/g.213450  ORF Transcript_76128/g.213450 Transcript_76128/m.213450 type:complete len:228 (+) Transcript_76128:74-757(+)